MNSGLGAYTSTNNANQAANTAKQNAKLQTAAQAQTQRLVIFGVIGVVIVGIIFFVLRRR